jgi:hypothetical protein
VGMPAAYSSPDLVPTLVVLYRCPCGAEISEYGQHAGELPPGWVEIAEGEYLCAHCAAEQART